MQSRWAVNWIFPVNRGPENHSSAKFLIEFFVRKVCFGRDYDGSAWFFLISKI